MNKIAYCLAVALALTCAALCVADDALVDRRVRATIVTGTMIVTNQDTRPEVVESVKWRYFNGGGITGTVTVEHVSNSDADTNVVHSAALVAITDHVWYVEGQLYLLKDDKLRIFDNSVLTGTVTATLSKGGR